MMVIILTLGWAVAGLVIGLPYLYLSGGTGEQLVAVTWLSPIGGATLFLLFRLWRATRHGGGFAKLFWGLLAWFCMPIIANGASHLFGRLDFVDTAHFLFRWRYLSMITTAPVLIASAAMLSTARKDGRPTDGTSPPSGSASGPSGPHGQPVADDVTAVETFELSIA